MKKVLYISYDGMTDPLGQSQVLPYLKGIAAAGYEIHLVSFEKTDKYKAQKHTIKALCKAAGIVWHPQDYHNEGGLRKTIRQIDKMKRVAVYLQFKHQFDLVHCRSYIAAIAGLMLKKRFKVKFIFDMRGFWADERVDGGLWDLKRPLYRQIYNYFKRKERSFLTHADYTISLTHRAKNEIESWNLPHQSPITVIPCCVDLDLFNPEKISLAKKDSLRKELGLSKDTFVLGYVGSIGTWYLLSEMLDYFAVFHNQNPNSHFVFISGEKPETILQLARTKNLSEHAISVRSVLHDQVPAYISIFNASIFFIKPTFSKMASSPTKQGEIMAMGIPLVCNSGIGDTDEIVNRYHAGIVLDGMNEDSYGGHLPDFKSLEPLTIIAGAKDYFSLELGVRDYLNVYRHVDA